MRNFQKVASPAIFPGMCISCKTSNGPFVDTNVNLPDNARVYLCTLCTRRASETMGFSEGEEMDRLIKSDTEMRRMRKDVEKAENTAQEAKEESALLTARLNDAEHELQVSETERSRLLGIVDSVRLLAEEAEDRLAVGG